MQREKMMLLNKAFVFRLRRVSDSVCVHSIIHTDYVGTLNCAEKHICFLLNMMWKRTIITVLCLSRLGLSIMFLFTVISRFCLLIHSKKNILDFVAVELIFTFRKKMDWIWLVIFGSQFYFIFYTLPGQRLYIRTIFKLHLVSLLPHCPAFVTERVAVKMFSPCFLPSSSLAFWCTNP